MRQRGRMELKGTGMPAADADGQGRQESKQGRRRRLGSMREGSKNRGRRQGWRALGCNESSLDLR